MARLTLPLCLDDCQDFSDRLSRELLSPGHNRSSGDQETVCRASAALGCVQVTVSGIGPFGSHGCSLTQSRTSQVPRSTMPIAASMIIQSCVFLWIGWDS